MTTMTDHEALTLAIFALNSYEHPDATTSDDLAHLDQHAEAARTALAKLRDRTQQPPARPHRCAVCGRNIAGPVQYAYGVDERTGDFLRFYDLAACVNCPNVMRDAAATTARQNGWTRTQTR